MIMFDTVPTVLMDHPVIVMLALVYLVLTVWYLVSKERTSTPRDAISYTVDASETVVTMVPAETVSW